MLTRIAVAAFVALASLARPPLRRTSRPSRSRARDLLDSRRHRAQRRRRPRSGDRVGRAECGRACLFAVAGRREDAVAAAQVVVVNGLGFEGWLDRLVKASGSKAPVVVATRGIKPMKAAAAMAMRTATRTATAIPMDERSARLAVGAERKDLCGQYPRRAGQGGSWRAGRCIGEHGEPISTSSMHSIKRGARRRSRRCRSDARRVITNHDAFGYFAAAYGLQFHRHPWRLDRRAAFGQGRGPDHRARSRSRRSPRCFWKTSPIRG